MLWHSKKALSCSTKLGICLSLGMATTPNKVSRNGAPPLTIFNRPNAIKERMRDGVLTKVKPHLLKPYLMKRDDYASAGIEKIVSISVLLDLCDGTANE